MDFLNASLHEDVYTKPLPGYHALLPGMILKLNNVLNGL